MLTTLEAAKSLLGIDPDDTSQDSPLMFSLFTASERIAQECRRSFRLQMYTDVRSGLGSTYFPLRNYPVHSVTEVKISGCAVTDFSLNEDILYRKNSWPCGEFNLTASYLGGYVLPGEATEENPRTLPQPLEYACIMLAETIMRQPGVAAERVGDISVTYRDEGTELPGSVKALIAPYESKWR